MIRGVAAMEESAPLVMHLGCGHEQLDDVPPAVIRASSIHFPLLSTLPR